MMTENRIDLNMRDAVQEQKYSRRWTVMWGKRRGSGKMSRRRCGCFETEKKKGK